MSRTDGQKPEQGQLLAIILGLMASVAGIAIPRNDSIALASASISVRQSDKGYAVRIPLDRYRPKVALAQDRVGATEPLASIARRHRALAAINGCFFNAYTRDAIKVPYHHLVTNGELVHIGNTGVTLGFETSGDYRMDRVRITLAGSLDGRRAYPDNWYTYRLNHPIESTSGAALFNRHWVGPLTPGPGTQVLVRNGHVEGISREPLPIPPDGFVIVLAGQEEYLVPRFQPGRRASYEPAIEASDPAFWSRAREALACGPRLLQDGLIRVDPASEGFTSPKILSLGGQRSAVGITRDRMLLLVTQRNATIPELALVMQRLGAVDAMNLDGGASSTLWVNDNYLVSPGRDMSSALLIVDR